MKTGGKLCKIYILILILSLTVGYMGAMGPVKAAENEAASGENTAKSEAVSGENTAKSEAVSDKNTAKSEAASDKNTAKNEAASGENTAKSEADTDEAATEGNAASGENTAKSEADTDEAAAEGNAASGKKSEKDEALSFTKEELAYIKSSGTLKVGYVTDRAPVSMQRESDGELGGVSRYIFDRIQELSGLKFEYVPLPSGPVTYDYLLGEGLDLVTSVEYNKQNENARGILMSKPYLSSRKVIVGHEGVTLSDNTHIKIAVSTGSQTLKKVLSEQYPGSEIIDYESVDKCFEAVEKGESDILILNQFVAEYQMYKPNYKHLRVLPAKGLEDELCFSAVVPLEESNDDDWMSGRMLIDVLNKTIGMIPEDEQVDYMIRTTLENPYHDTPAEFLYRYRYTVIVLLIAFLLLCGMAVAAMRARVQAARVRADEEMRNQFLSTMSHEIRTPINGLIGLNYLMFQNMGNEEKLAAYLKQSSSTTRYLMALLGDILDISKMQQKMLELEEEPYRFDYLISAVESIEDSRMREKEIDFHVEKKILYPDLVGDEVRVEQVVLKLLDNACKFTPRGGKVRLEVTQVMLRDGRIETEIKVSDTGCGISEEFQKRIFDSFAQERSTVSKGNEGVGLGMAISYHLAKLMHGDLQVKSSLGEGSEFTFTFLSDIAEADAGAMQRTERNPEDGPAKVLVVEDNELNAEILTELLEEAGFETRLAVNGQEAVDIFSASETGEYPYILMDLLMPVKNGFQAAEEIRGLDREDAGSVKIIACTANAFEEDRQKALAVGMNGFIPKPVDINRLFEMLR